MSINNINITENTTKIVTITTPGPPGPPLVGVTQDAGNIIFSKTLKVGHIYPTSTNITFGASSNAFLGSIATFDNFSTLSTGTGSFGHVTTTGHIHILSGSSLQSDIPVTGEKVRLIGMETNGVVNVGTTLAATSLFGLTTVIDALGLLYLDSGTGRTTFRNGNIETGDGNISGSSTTTASFGHLLGDRIEASTGSFGNFLLNDPDGNRYIEMDSDVATGESATLTIYESDDPTNEAITLGASSTSGQINLYNSNNDLPRIRLAAAGKNFFNSPNGFFIGKNATGTRMGAYDVSSTNDFDDDDGEHLNVNVFGGIMTTGSDSGRVQIHNGHVTASGTVSGMTSSFNTNANYPWIKTLAGQFSSANFNLLAQAGISEGANASVNAETVVGIAPFAGHLDFILLDFGSNPGSASLGIFITGSDKAINATQGGTEFTFAKEKYTFDVDNVSPDVNVNRVMQVNFSASFNAGDRFAIGLDIDDNPLDVNATAVFKLDTSKGYPTGNSDSSFLHVN